VSPRRWPREPDSGLLNAQRLSAEGCFVRLTARSARRSAVHRRVPGAGRSRFLSTGSKRVLSCRSSKATTEFVEAINHELKTRFAPLLSLVLQQGTASHADAIVVRIKGGESHTPKSPNRRALPIDPIIASHQMSFKQFVLFKSLDRRSYDQGENTQHRQNCDALRQCRPSFADVRRGTIVILSHSRAHPIRHGEGQDALN
jgi:hypothetical protein